MELKAIKDGNGNIVITEDSFEMLLTCLDNQKFINEGPQNGDSLAVGKEQYNKTQEEIQTTIDKYNLSGRKILNQKYTISTVEESYFLVKKYEHQDAITPWTSEDVGLVYELFKDTIIEYIKPTNLLPLDGTEDTMAGTNPIGKDKDGWLYYEPEPTPWLIERPLRFDNDYLTISENGRENRPWKPEEIIKIQKQFNKK